MIRIVVACSAAIALACSSPSGVPPAYCADQPGVEDFETGMQSIGPSGVVVDIVGATPSVVQEGLNDWTVSVHDANGNPIVGATLSVVPNMPAHGHNSPTDVVITDRGGGLYDLGGVNLSMRGVWLIPIRVEAPSVSDTASFTFCVDGAS